MLIVIGIVEHKNSLLYQDCYNIYKDYFQREYFHTGCTSKDNAKYTLRVIFFRKVQMTCKHYLLVLNIIF